MISATRRIFRSLRRKQDIPVLAAPEAIPAACPLKGGDMSQRVGGSEAAGSLAMHGCIYEAERV
jgi:hypothetical protein